MKGKVFLIHRCYFLSLVKQWICLFLLGQATMADFFYETLQKKDSDILLPKISGSTLRSQIEGYTRLLIFRKFSTLPAVIWASPFINFQENFQLPCFSPTQMKIFPPSPLLLEPTRLLNLKKNSSLPFY